MENFSYHVPMYIVTTGVATQGHSSTIRGGQVGLVDRQTWSIATPSGNGKEFFFAQGAMGGIDWNGAKVEGTHKSPYFFAKNVTKMYKSLPARLQNEEWVIGYDGSQGSRGFTFTKGQTTRLKFIFSGDPIYRKFGGPKEYQVSYTVPQDCTDPLCVDDCAEAGLDCRDHTIKIIDLINNHVELKQFGVTAKLVTDTYLAGVPDHTKYCLTICDTGDAAALQKVQAQAPLGVKVARTGRSGAMSTYQFCRLTSLGAPSNFTQSGAIALADCGTCPAGSTLVESQTEWLITRPLMDDDAISDDVDKQTYADAIGTAYEASLAKTFNGTVAGVDVAADTITVTGHGFATGDKVTYSNGGGTSITGITTATDYYVIRVDEDTVQLATTAALAYAGTARDLTVVGVGVAHTLTPVITAVFLTNTGGTAIVKLTTSSGAVLEALAADIVIQGATHAVRCVFGDATPVAWTSCGEGISGSRTLKTKLARPKCDEDGDRMAELEALLSQFEGVSELTKIEGDGCVDEYTVIQKSQDCLDEGCLTENVTFTYETLPSLDDAIWEVVPEAEGDNLTRKCGIRVTAGYIDPKFGDCSFDPRDYYNDEPVRFELAVFDESADGCDYASLPTVFRSRIGTIQRQTGEWVIREVLMKNEAYLKHVKQYDKHPRMREAFDMNMLNMVDRNAYYVLYYISFNDSYHLMDRKNESEKFTAVFAFKEGDASAMAFEAGPIAILTGKSGVTLEINE